MSSRMVRVAGALAGLLWAAGAAGAAGIEWSQSFDAALAKAKASKKLVMADFYTDW